MRIPAFDIPVRALYSLSGSEMGAPAGLIIGGLAVSAVANDIRLGQKSPFLHAARERSDELLPRVEACLDLGTAPVGPSEVVDEDWMYVCQWLGLRPVTEEEHTHALRHLLMLCASAHEVYAGDGAVARATDPSIDPNPVVLGDGMTWN